MHVTIRPLKQSDIGNLCEIFNHPNVVRNISQLPYATEEQWQKRLLSDNQNVTLVADHDGLAQGSITLAAESNMRRKHVATLAIAVNPEYHNLGIGTRLLDAGMSLADEWMNVARLELGVFTSNRQAIKLYRRFGFAIEGEARAYAYGEGGYQNLLYMARVRKSRRAAVPKRDEQVMRNRQPEAATA